MSQPEKVETTQLWSDYYLAKKPYCHSCAKQGIKEQEYQFCSEAQITPNNYQCLVKHWTIYQGQTRLNLPLAFHSKSTPLSLALHETYGAMISNVSVNRIAPNPLIKTAPTKGGTTNMPVRNPKSKGMPEISKFEVNCPVNRMKSTLATPSKNTKGEEKPLTIIPRIILASFYYDEWAEMGAEGGRPKKWDDANEGKRASRARAKLKQGKTLTNQEKELLGLIKKRPGAYQSPLGRAMTPAERKTKWKAKKGGNM